MKIYRLKTFENAKFRTGKKGWDDVDDIVHSDTLFSAIVNCFALLYSREDTDKLIEEFNKGNIRISSLFLSFHSVSGNVEKFIYFVPKPNIRFSAAVMDDDIISIKKKVKKIKFISLKLFQEILQNISKEDNGLITNFDLLNNQEVINWGEFCYHSSELPHKELPALKREEVITRVRVNRAENENDENYGPYYETHIYLGGAEVDNIIFKLEPYFCVCINSCLESKFNAAVRLACDEGFGGETSLGRGIFKDVAIVDLNHYSIPKDIYVNLSLVNPSQNELRLIYRHDIIKRGGYIYSSQIPALNNIEKSLVFMIKEGSVFTGKITGRIMDVTPDKDLKHKIYRNGIGFYL